MPIKVLDVRAHFAEERGQTIKMLVAGPPGAGKTRLASTFPAVLYADAEGRLLSVRDRPVKAVRIETVKDLEDLRNALDQRPEIREKLLGFPVQTVVLDTVDEIARIMMRERLQAAKRDAFARDDWGAHGDQLRDILRGFRNLTDLNVILNVHLKGFEDKETERMEYRPSIQGAVGGEIAEYVDECFLLGRRTSTDPLTGERVPLRFLQTYADSQHDWLKDHSGALPMEFPIDLTTDYERMAKLIFGDARVPTAEDLERKQRAEEAATWRPPAESAAPVEPPRKKAARKKAASVEQAPVEQVEQTVSVEPVEPPAPELPAERDEPVVEETIVATPEAASLPPDTAVPEIGTESPEVPAEEPASGPACAVCGTTDINENYLELSEARWGVFLCKDDFLERNRSK